VLVQANEASLRTDPDLEEAVANAFFVTWHGYQDGEGPKHPDPDPQGWTTYSEIETIEPIPGEKLHAEPSLKSKDMGSVKGEYLKILKFKGDWVFVQEPSEIDWLPVGEDHSDILKVRWNSKRQGWIRWQLPGPVPGSHRNRMRGKAYFGIID
jgi:hypothetical protein